jgi:hypothetical protein
MTVAWRRQHAGDRDNARQLDHEAADRGDATALPASARCWEHAGEADKALRAIRFGSTDAGDCAHSLE